MIGSNFIRFMIALFFFSFSLYSYIDKQNSCTALKLQLPKVQKEIEAMQEKNANLRYQIACFEAPEHLLAIATQEAYTHLKFPFTQEIITVSEGLPLNLNPSEEEFLQDSKLKTAVVIGAK